MQKREIAIKHIPLFLNHSAVNQFSAITRKIHIQYIKVLDIKKAI